jgi:FdhD protein
MMDHSEPVSLTPTFVVKYATADGRIQGMEEQRYLAEEVPINFSYGGIAYAVMMASPSDLFDFAYGFSLTEGIVDRPDQIRDVRVLPVAEGIRLEIDLTPDALHRHLSRTRARTFGGRTGCGLCGIEDLKDLPRPASILAHSDQIDVLAIKSALAALDDLQPINALSHSVHAAALVNNAGQIVCVREDVGRHNALDKLVGAAICLPQATAWSFVLLTSRCSFEMVEKAARLGCRTLVSISAPTKLGVDRARAYGMNLVGIARRDGMIIFNDATRAVQENAA